jgi:hypothetical protein
MTRHRFLLGFAVLSISLLVVSIETQAKVLSKNSKRELRVSSTARDALGRTSIVKVIRRDAASSKRSATRRSTCACSCRVNQDEFDATGCFGSCLRSWGVNVTNGTYCVGVCVAAGTGNPVAIGVCAACLGTAEWIVAGCSLKCVWGRALTAVDAVKQPHTHRPPNTAPGGLLASSQAHGS